MSVNLVADILLIVLAVGWILFKQVRPAPVKTRLLVIVPVILAYFGITTTAAKTWSNSPDLLLIVLGAAISVALGLPRGSTIRVWLGDDGRWWRQGSKATLALWGALFVARGGLYLAAQATGHQAASGVGPLLFALAISFAAQNAVIAIKMRQGSGSDAAEPYQLQHAPVPARSDFSSSATPPYPGRRAPAYAGVHANGSLHERAEQRRAERRARRAARRQEW
jgi:hypothetical protein